MSRERGSTARLSPAAVLELEESGGKTEIDVAPGPREVPKPVEPTDLDLLRRYRRKDEEAFRQFIERYQNQVYTFFKKNHPKEQATDLTTDTFIEMMEYARKHDFDGPEVSEYGGRVERLLFRMANNIEISSLRDTTREQKKFKTYQILHIPAERPQKPDEAAHLAQVTAFVDEAITKLPAEMQEPARLHVFCECTPQEVARITGTSRRVAALRIGGALRLLRSFLASKLGKDSHDE